MNIELTTTQFLALAALALACGVAFGIAIGIKLYESYGSDSKRKTTSGRKLGSCLEVR